VNQNVNRAKYGDGLLNEAGNGILARYIRLKRDSLVTFPLETIHKKKRRFARSVVVDDDVGAVRRQLVCNPIAEA
jgi:hypothetical protein